MDKRYSLKHPHAVVVNYDSLQSVADALFDFRNNPYFENYTIVDNQTGIVYRVKNSEFVNGIEFTRN